MIRKLCLPAVTLCLVLATALAQAAVPISVFPNPVQFGAVPLNSPSYPATIFVTNVTTSDITISGMAISGTNGTDFAFYGSPCLFIISGGQSCQMQMTLTPSAMGDRTANLVISIQGQTTPVTIPLDGTGGNPIPNITSLSPPSAYIGGPAVTLTITGTGFVSGSIAYLNNSALTTSFVSSTKITAVVPSSNLTSSFNNFVSVTNPPPAGGSSVGFTFNIVALDPTLSYTSPASVVAGSAPTPIILNGQNFMNGATVLVNGASLPATYLSPQQLQIQPTAAQIATPNLVQLAVRNPSPGTTSPSIYFNVSFPANVTVLNLPANDLVWDPFAQRIYASLPSTYGPSGNTIAVINPATGAINGYHFAGSEPGKLALSSDSQYLYVGLNGNGSVQRLLLPKFTADIDVSLSSSQFGGLYLANDLAVSPADPHTFAVALGFSGCCGGGPLEFFRDSTLLANSVTNPIINNIAFVSGSTLYGYSQNTLTQVAVSSTGGSYVKQWNSILQGNEIRYDTGLVYSSGGQAFNPSTGLLVGTYDVGAACCGNSPSLVLPDAAINRVFALGNSQFLINNNGSNNSNFAITSYNLSTFTPTGIANLSQFNSTASPAYIRWGSSGLAFLLQTQCCGSAAPQVVLVQSPAMLLTSGAKSNPVPLLTLLTPSSATHGRGNLAITIQGSAFVPGSQVSWNGTSLYADYVSATQLTLYVPAAQFAAAGTANILVKNPAPGGGTSTPLTFTIN
jgi:trimeric autotransporter adhesin